MATALEQLKPKQNPNITKPKFDHPFHKLCSFRVPIVIQQKGGNVIRGRAKWFRNGFLKLTDAEVVGTNKQVMAEWLLVDHQTIAHVHPDSEAKVGRGDENGASG